MTKKNVVKKVAKLDVNKFAALIEMAISEDLGRGDMTSELFIKDQTIATANIVSREEIVLCGIDIVAEIFKKFDPELKLRPYAKDGQRIHVGGKIAKVQGPLCSMLTAERVSLNFLQRLSGISTTTYKFVSAVTGTKAKIYDTRKTTPGWRLLEKYAVRCGGGYNHRLGLYD